MKRALSILVVAVFGVFLTGHTVQAQSQNANNLRAAYVNLERVLQNDSGYQQALKDLEEYKTNLQNRINKQEQELKKMRKNIQKNSLLSKQQRQKKRKKLMREARSLRKRAQKSQQLMKRKKQELLSPVLERIDPIVRDVAKSRGYNVIYSYGKRDNPSVLWVSEDVNITSAVIDRLKRRQS